MKLKNPITCISISAAVSTVLLMASAASAQNIYVANWFSPGAIYDFTPGGSVNTFHSGGLGEPEGLAFDGSGNLYAADSAGGQIDEFIGGTESTYASSLSNPVGIAFDGSSGNLFAAGGSSGKIYEVSGSAGHAVTTFATGLNLPDSIAFDQSGDMFVSIYNSGTIDEYQNNGGTLSSSASVFAQGLTDVTGIAFDAQGSLYASYNGASGEVEKITSPGHMSVYGTGISSPNQIAFDNSGDLFVCNNGGVTEFAPGGGTGTVIESGLGNPTGIAIQGIALPVPEPSTWALTALGAVGFLFRRKKQGC